MSITLFKRIDIDIVWYFPAISLGFTIHNRGLQLSLIFVDISIYYVSPKWTQSMQDRYKKYQEMADQA